VPPREGESMEQREQWGSRMGFILAAAGSAIGLGDVWRWPYIAYSNGGGAFFIPYLFAFLTAGIPILLLEYAIGHRYRGSTPLSFRRIDRRYEWVGWWQVGISFVIGCYYAVIIAWAASYVWFSFGSSWGNNPERFFLTQYLQAPAQPSGLGGPVANVLLPLLGVWALTLYVLVRGVKRGIELASRIMMPVFFVLFILLVIRAVTLPGATEGLNTLFKPDWASITDSQVWIAAYAQIFFSLSICFAIMVTYASYLPRRADLSNTALIVGFSNSSVELLAGIGVFGALGFLASATNSPVQKVAEEGIPLIFIAFPTLIDQMPALNQVFAVVFFFSLVIAGFTSQISIVEVYVSALREKFEISRTKAVAIGGGVAALVSLTFATRGGLYVLDAADHYINEVAAVTAGLLEVALVAWLFRKLDELRVHTNAVSDIVVGRWWTFMLTVITPVMLIYMLFNTLRFELFGKSNYENYPTDFLFQYGWIVVIASLVIGALLTFKRWNRETVDLDVAEEVSA
jgi:NSS family neurotransmitter:Na+ symporter